MSETLTSGFAGRLMHLVEELFGGFSPVALRTWDGGFAGPAGAPVVVLRSPQALRQLLWSPGELGLARAYVTGDLDVEGDLAEGFRRVWASRGAKPGKAALARALRAIPEVLGPRPPVPASEARLRGKRHARDQAFHYDLPNEFYELILDPSMAYSCARWAPGDSLADAQRRKLDLVCRKLNLRRGDRLLDVGCGWGSMILYAAREYGARATGVTVSREQRAFIRTKSAGVEVRLQDYRDITGEPYDAISSIEMGEHVGEENYPAFAATLFRMVKPGGRVVVQQRSRGAGEPGGGPFIERYIAPDLHLRQVGETIAVFEEAGFEAVHVESMREDYARTAHAWHETFEFRYDRAVALVGAELARVWRLYLVGGGLAFERGRMGVHQITLAR
ncbi:cyclopropane-fatty-acyl-phospholipid synthase [Acrocarpospora pleiomorpha]|uniref:Cyclopropane-fatty-acyl-phospholipid synthase n=1 Tax=Acrocarpospora pleiomorpha TaxID=90975 RepID=A0A5M3X7Z6_9ACTN|nr:cyclopropane-fatty-acyl-phospholipid synthase family protein [Acrocarpospora pleiomorpha]GES17797.1 cyclopropane-fatty-acyl-phospholipid synthase [Acrocarpospora pleiomorpha]